LLVAGVWLAVDTLRAREVATRAARQACSQQGLQFLDDTVHGGTMRFARDGEGVARLRRVFAFEFSDDGISRRSGSVIVLGGRVEALRLDPYREH